MTITTEVTDIDLQINKLKELIKLQEEANDLSKSIAFISIKDFCQITGWSESTVQNLFNRPDFPSCDFGKEKKAEVHAVIKYFSVPRRKE